MKQVLVLIVAAVAASFLDCDGADRPVPVKPRADAGLLDCPPVGHDELVDGATAAVTDASPGCELPPGSTACTDDCAVCAGVAAGNSFLCIVPPASHTWTCVADCSACF